MRTGRPPKGKIIPCSWCGKLVYRSPCQIGRTLCSHACRDAKKRAERINDAEGTARCAKCREWKPIAEFVKGGLGKLHSYCKPCSSDWFAERRKTDPEVRKPYRPAYRLTDEQKKENKRAANHMQHQARRAAGEKPHKFDIQRMICNQGGRCAYCNELLLGKYHIDHKTPVSKGGTNALDNLHLTCPRCNLKKSDLTHEEFLVSKRRRPFRQIGPVGRLP